MAEQNPGTTGTATIEYEDGKGFEGPAIHGRETVVAWDGGQFISADLRYVVRFKPDGGQPRCVHGDTAEELCNMLPSAAELADMRQALTTAGRLQERLMRLTPEAVRRALQVGAWRPEHQQDTMVRRVLALVAEPAPVPDSARAAELIRFHLQRPDISASDRAELAAFADSLDAKPDAAPGLDGPRCDVDPVAHEERLAYLEPDAGQE